MSLRLYDNENLNVYMDQNRCQTKIKFYSGINTIALFNKIFRLVQPI